MMMMMMERQKSGIGQATSLTRDWAQKVGGRLTGLSNRLRLQCADVCRQGGLAENEVSVDDVIKSRDNEIGGSQWGRDLPVWSREARVVPRALANYGEKSYTHARTRRR